MSGGAVTPTLFEAVPQILERLGGFVDGDELRYQLDRIDLEPDEEAMADLVERGMVELTAKGYTAVVTRRPEVKRTAAHPHDPEDIIAKVRLWALIVGRPPTRQDWHPSRRNASMEKLVARARAFTRMQWLYKTGDWPSVETVCNQFGSLNAALMVAGYEPRGPGRERGRGYLPRPAPEVGPETIADRQAGVDRARECGDKDALKLALYELGIAAMTEADRL